MPIINKIIMAGIVETDPQEATTTDNTTFTKFTITTDSFYIVSEDGTNLMRTEPHNIVAFKKLGKFCAKRLNKGNRVYIEGKLYTFFWKEENGNKKYRTEIVISNINILERTNEKENIELVF